MRYGAAGAGLAATVLLAGCGQATQPPRDEDDASPAGRSFVVTGIEGPAHPVGEGTTVRLDFTEDEVAAYAGCNHMSGQVTYVGDVLVVRSLGATEMACDPPLMAGDAWVSHLLTSRPTFTVEGPALTLVEGDTTVRLHEVSEES